MKVLLKLLCSLRPTALFFMALCVATTATANPSDYFTTSIANNGTYYWDLPNWSTNSTGPFTSSWLTTNFARFTGGSGDTYTVVVSNTDVIGGMYMTTGSGTTLILTNTPGGNLNITTIGASPVSQNGFTWQEQGFLTAGGNFEIYAPLTGSGGVSESSGGGHLELLGTNTYSGGTIWGSSSTFVDYNNNSSFGTGQLAFNGTTFSIVENLGPSGVTITNGLQTIGACGINFIGNASTFSGNWYLGGAANNINIRNNGVSNTLTLGGILSSTTGTVNYSGANGGTILLTNINTYTGATSIGIASDSSITLEIAATGSLASTVITNFGSGATLKLDGPTCLSTNAQLQLPSSGATVNLNYTGTNTILALYIGGTLQASGVWGSSSSGAPNTSPMITGTGFLLVGGKPTITQQPLPLGRLNGSSATFSVGALGSQPFTYQWLKGASPISGATSQAYTINPVSPSSAGNYSVIISNSFGAVTSSVVALDIVETNAYSSTIAGDGPLSYWRLDETSGSIAFDCIGTNNGFYTNVLLGQPGCFLGLDPDTAIGIPGASATNVGFVNVTNFSPFNWAETTPPGSYNQLTIEGWVAFTNLNGSQRLFSCGSYYGGGFGFGISGNSTLQFTTFGKEDYNQPLGNALTTNVWYYLAVTYDYNNNFNFYLNGNLVGSLTDNSGSRLTTAVSVPVCIGANGPGYWAPFGATASNYFEEVKGFVDEVAFYTQPLGSSQIMNHYNARFGSSQYPVTTQPTVSPTTTYATLSATFTEQAGGPQLSYQWYASSSGAISGANNSTFTLSPLSVSNTDTYYCQVSNPAATSNSPTVSLTVLPIPTNASQLNLTNALVLHMPFDGDDKDYSGRGHNGTAVGAPYFTNGVIGSGALHYYTDTTAQSTNYVTLGLVSDLQFGTSTDFTVSMWVREVGGQSYTNLPFFTDATSASGFTPGYTFAPYDGTNDNSQPTWVAIIAGTSTISIPNAFDSFAPGNPINDGNWHNLIFVASRSGSLTVYVDGTQVDAESDSYAGNINTSNSTVIGQDALGAYGVTGAADLDDLCVWQRTLSQLEVSGIYLGGSVNGISPAPNVSSTPVHVTLTVTNNAGQLQLVWSGGPATIQASTNAAGPYTNLTTATSPYNIHTNGAQMFYRLHP